jgi:hypothetical protein
MREISTNWRVYGRNGEAEPRNLTHFCVDPPIGRGGGGGAGQAGLVERVWVEVFVSLGVEV